MPIEPRCLRLGGVLALPPAGQRRQKSPLPPPLPLELSLDLAPEIDANLSSVDVVIGEPVIGRARPITLSGAGGYSRTYFAIYVPEPGTLSLMAAGCLLLRRRRGNRAD